MKIVINKCHGGFTLSDAAYEWLIARGINLVEESSLEQHDAYVVFKSSDHRYGKYWGYYWHSHRTDPLLIELIETLGSLYASGANGKLEIIEIPDGVAYIVCEYKGMEWIAEKHRTWE